jgi:hypothetical protein
MGLTFINRGYLQIECKNKLTATGPLLLTIVENTGLKPVTLAPAVGGERSS